MDRPDDGKRSIKFSLKAKRQILATRLSRKKRAALMCPVDVSEDVDSRLSEDWRCDAVDSWTDLTSVSSVHHRVALLFSDSVLHFVQCSENKNAVNKK